METNGIKGMKIYRGNPLVMGATVVGDSVNFAITAKLGSKCELVLYKKGEKRYKKRKNKNGPKVCPIL